MMSTMHADIRPAPLQDGISALLFINRYFVLLLVICYKKQNKQQQQQTNKQTDDQYTSEYLGLHVWFIYVLFYLEIIFEHADGQSCRTD